MLPIGIFLIVAAVVLVVVHVFARRKTGHLLAAANATPGGLSDLASKISGELGGGGFSEFATLTGEGATEQPLVSPLGVRPCLYYRMTVTRRYEEEYTERDQQGNTRHKTRTGSETMSTQEEFCDFHLQGSDGHLPVHLEGASFDNLIETVDRFEPAGNGMAVLSLGRFRMSLGNVGSGRRTLGYQYREHILPAGTQLTVVGLVTDSRGGGLSAGRGGAAFIVSTRTKKEMLGSAKRTANLTAIGSGLCLLAGAILTVIGALQS
jgi:hypothetical protein